MLSLNKVLLFCLISIAIVQFCTAQPYRQVEYRNSEDESPDLTLLRLLNDVKLNAEIYNGPTPKNFSLHSGFVQEDRQFMVAKFEGQHQIKGGFRTVSMPVLDHPNRKLYFIQPELDYTALNLDTNRFPLLIREMKALKIETSMLSFSAFRIHLHSFHDQLLTQYFCVDANRGRLMLTPFEEKPSMIFDSRFYVILVDENNENVLFSYEIKLIEPLRHGVTCSDFSA